MEVIATAKFVRVTARKARLVAATVQGMPVAEALTLLAFTPKYAAVDVSKVIKSAAANAEHNYNLDSSSLTIARIEVDGAGMIKRFRPRAQGRAFSIYKRNSHIRVLVTDDGPAASKGAARVIRATGSAKASETAAEPEKKSKSTAKGKATGKSAAKTAAKTGSKETAKKSTAKAAEKSTSAKKADVPATDMVDTETVEAKVAPKVKPAAKAKPKVTEAKAAVDESAEPENEATTSETATRDGGES